jgi:hypothetical protein
MATAGTELQTLSLNLSVPHVAIDIETRGKAPGSHASSMAYIDELDTQVELLRNTAIQ